MKKIAFRGWGREQELERGAKLGAEKWPGHLGNGFPGSPWHPYSQFIFILSFLQPQSRGQYILLGLYGPMLF